MINIIRINELPEGSGSLSNDDILLFMDDPSGSGVTKRITLGEISNLIGGEGSGNAITIVDGNYISSNLVDNTYTINVTGLQPSGDYSSVGHSHSSSDIIDFNSSVSGLLPTINNSGDNRILTSTGSSYGIDAETNLTFNGFRLSVDCTCSSGAAGYEAIGDNNKSTLIRQQSYSDIYILELNNDEEIQVRGTNRFVAISGRGTKASPQPLEVGDTMFIMRNDAYNPHGTLYNGNLDHRTMRLYSIVTASGTHYLGSDFVINTSTGGPSLFDNSFKFTHDGKILINDVDITTINNTPSIHPFLLGGM